MKAVLLFLSLFGVTFAVTTIELLAGNKYNQFSDIVGYVVQTNLMDKMNNGNFTLFAPSNTAFLKLSQEYTHTIKTDMNALHDLLTYHVLNRTLLSSDMQNEMIITMVDGVDARLNIYEKNGHRVITIDGSKIMQPDNIASNGVVHYLDSIMRPAEGSILDIISKNPELSFLYDRIKAANLENVLQKDPLTLFAPSNNAFGQLTPASMNGILANTTYLSNLLKYHMTDSTQYLAGLTMEYGMQIATLLPGADLYARMSFPGLLMNGLSLVSTPDIVATNGVVHIIDQVLTPPSSASAIVG